MKLLLDTHVLLWSLNDSDRLGPTARSLLADRANDVLVSVASLWEVALKSQVGKLRADLQGISNAITRSGVALLGINVAHLVALTGLPRHHKDPFDHLLIAQAMSENAALMSDDRNMPKYPVQVIGCSA